jgi:hypothetical protein
MTSTRAWFALGCCALPDRSRRSSSAGFGHAKPKTTMPESLRRTRLQTHTKEVSIECCLIGDRYELLRA